MELVFLFGTVQALFLSLLIFSKNKKSTGDYVLGTWIIFIGLHLLDSYFHSSGLVLENPHLIGIGYNFPMLQGPFLFVYVLVMVSETGRFKSLYWLHGIPFLISSVYLMFVFYFLNAPEKLIFGQTQFASHNTALKLIWTFKVFTGPVYVIMSLVKLNKHQKEISEKFSYSENINLIWLKYVIAGMGFGWLVVLLTMFLRQFFPSVNFARGDYAIYLAVTAVIFFLGYFGFKQQVIYAGNTTLPNVIKDNKHSKNEVTKEEKSLERYRKSGLDEITAKEYLKHLLHFMDTKKPYLNGTLSLKEVADSLNITVNHLSQVINEQAGMSFYEFVNKYRVDEVKARLADPENEQFTLIGIAYDCGFNSKSSFYGIFKKNTGMTPSQYSKIQIS